MEEIVVITGASAGVGRAAARAFATRGARVGLIARGREGLDAAAKDVESRGGTPLILPADVADAEAVEAAAAQVERDLGPIDVWVNDAMCSVFSPVKETAPEEFRRITDVTYLGVVNGTLAALKRMLPRDRGTIVQVGSALSYRSIPLQAAYCGAKHAINGFTQALRTELLHDRSNVRVSVVQMPALNTPQFEWVRTRLPNHPQPVPPIYQPEVAARAIVYASERAPRELWVGGTTVATIIANKIVPGLLDRYLAKTGYKGQQADFPVEPGRRDNIDEPVPGDHGVHGIFDEKARARSAELWLRLHRARATAIALGVAGAAIGARRLGERRSQ
ncbi:MAG: SDR family oxidoreductase [Actinomycetota bacterium]